MFMKDQDKPADSATEKTTKAGAKSPAQTTPMATNNASKTENQGKDVKTPSTKATDAATKTQLEPEPKPAMGKSSAAAPTRPATATGLYFLAVVALIIAIGAGAGAYYLWQQLPKMQHSVNDLQAEMEQKSSELAQQWSSQLNDESEKSSEKIIQLNERQDKLKDSLTVVRQMVGRNGQDWILAEVESLLVIANHRLKLGKDVATAIEALNIADQRLRDHGDPALIDVRGQIVKEISALKSIARPDIEKLVLLVDSFLPQVAQLPLDAPKPKKLDPFEMLSQQETSETQSPQDWRQDLANVWTEMQKLLVVRRLDKPITPMLSEEQEQIIREVLRLKLESIKAAILRSDDGLRKSAIASTQDWLASHFLAEDSAVHNLSAELQNLEQAPLRLKSVDISKSLSMLRYQNQLRAKQAMQRNAAETASIKPPREPAAKPVQPKAQADPSLTAQPEPAATAAAGDESTSPSARQKPTLEQVDAASLVDENPSDHTDNRATTSEHADEAARNRSSDPQPQ